MSVTRWSQTATQRFWDKVVKTEGCWLWTGGQDGSGYAKFWFEGRKVPAHRWVYEEEVGPIPPGWIVDHVWDRGCRHRHCVKPAHLEAVTHAENIRRGFLWQREVTHCPGGHEYVPDNVYVNSKGSRECLVCRRRWTRESHRRRRANQQQEAS